MLSRSAASKLKAWPMRPDHTMVGSPFPIVPLRVVKSKWFPQLMPG